MMADENTGGAAAPADNTPLSLNDAAERIGGLLGDGADDPVYGEDEPRDEYTPDPEPADDDEPAPVGDDADDEPDQDEPEDGPQDDADADLPDIVPPASMTAKQAEEFRQLPREMQEYIATREKERDSGTQKAAEQTAAERKEAEARRAELDQRERQALSILERFAANEPAPPSKEMLDPNSDKYDPVEYMRLQGEYTEQVQEFQRAQADYVKLRETREQEAQAEQQAYLKQEKEKLQAVLPEFFDPKTGPKLQEELTDFAKSRGFDTERLRFASAADVQTLHDAYQYRKLKDKAPKAADKLKALPKVQKPGAKRSGNQVAADALAKQRAKLRKTGRVEDAAALFMNME